MRLPDSAGCRSHPNAAHDLGGAPVDVSQIHRVRSLRHWPTIAHLRNRIAECGPIMSHRGPVIRGAGGQVPESNRGIESPRRDCVRQGNTPQPAILRHAFGRDDCHSPVNGIPHRTVRSQTRWWPLDRPSGEKAIPKTQSRYALWSADPFTILSIQHFHYAVGLANQDSVPFGEKALTRGDLRVNVLDGRNVSSYPRGWRAAFVKAQ